MRRALDFGSPGRHRAGSGLARVPSYLWKVSLGLCAAGFLYSALSRAPMHEILAALRHFTAWQILVILGLDASVFVLITARWWLIVRANAKSARFLPMLEARLAAFGVSYFTLGPQVGGESAQLLYLRRQHHFTYARAGVIILFDKSLELITNFVFLIIGLIALIQSGVLRPAGMVTGLVICLGIVVASALAYMLFQRREQDSPADLLRRLIPRRKGATVARVVHLFRRIVTKYYRTHPRLLAAAVGCSLLGCAAAVAEYMLMASFVGVHLGLLQLVAAWAAGWLSFLVPWPAGAGTLEASQVLTLGIFGVPAAVAMGLTFLARGRDIIFGAVGLLLGANLLATLKSKGTGRAVLPGVKVDPRGRNLINHVSARGVHMDDIIVSRQVAARIPTRYGPFRLALYHNSLDLNEHLALVMGEVRGMQNVLVRLHSECFTSDVVGSLRCDCGEQLERSLQLIGIAKRGVVLYLRQEGRGIGLLDKLRAYNLQDEGHDTVEANLMLGHAPDERDYTVAALMLRDLGVRSINLMTNNPVKIRELRRLGVDVSQRTSIEVPARPENAGYLRTKLHRMNHLLRLAGSYHPSKEPASTD